MLVRLEWWWCKVRWADIIPVAKFNFVSPEFWPTGARMLSGDSVRKATYYKTCVTVLISTKDDGLEKKSFNKAKQTAKSFILKIRYGWRYILVVYKPIIAAAGSLCSDKRGGRWCPLNTVADDDCVITPGAAPVAICG